ncbi:MAG: hypothetical protein WBD71_10670, partial [Xanthobacteraceae bacterium]
MSANIDAQAVVMMVVMVMVVMVEIRPGEDADEAVVMMMMMVVVVMVEILRQLHRLLGRAAGYP